MKQTKLYLLIIAVLVIAGSCKKGAEDPSVSLLSRKSRLTGKWKQTVLSLDGVPQNSSLSVFYTFKADGSLQVFTTNHLDTAITHNNEWSFISAGDGFKNKERILVTNSTPSRGTIYEIVMLKSKMLKLHRLNEQIQNEDMIFIAE